MTSSWWTSSVAPSFEEAPIEWKTGLISGSFFNLSAYPICFHASIGQQEYYTKVYTTEMHSPEANYSASLAYWHLIHTGSEAGKWSQIH